MNHTTIWRRCWMALLMLTLTLICWTAAHAVPLLGLTTTNRLLRFDSATPNTVTATQVTGLQAGELLLGIDFRPATGQLYALGNTSRLYLIDPASGAATVIGTEFAPALAGTSFGFDFNPVVDRIRVVSNTSQNFRLNPNNGTITGTDTPLTYPILPVVPNVVASAYTDNLAGAPVTILYGIESTTNRLVRQGGYNGNPSPNGGVLTVLGALGFDTTEQAGMDIAPGSGIAYASMTAPAATNSQLFTINLQTGAASPLGNIGGGEPLAGLAVVPTPVNIVALTNDNSLVRFNAATPGNVSAPIPITGVTTGETIVGIDFRPANGQLYAVTTPSGQPDAQNSIYTINTTTGVATRVGGFGGLTGGGFVSTRAGVDFNPVPDRFRIVNDVDQNLRVNPDTGALAGADTPLAYAPGDQAEGINPNVTAAAYTNNFTGATTTTLYGIDTNRDTIVRQGGVDGNPSPNGGQLTTVGHLGFNFSDDSGLDIQGNSNVAYAGLTNNGVPGIYTINLNNFNVVFVGPIGVNTGIRDITIAPNGTFTFLLVQIADLDEGDIAPFAVIRTGDISLDATVEFATADGTALQRSDYQLTTGLLHFAAGETGKSVDVASTDDLFVDPSESFTVNLTAPTSGFFTVNPRTASYRIPDNDTFEPGPQVFVANLRGGEEVPPIATPAQGAGQITLNPDNTIRVVLQFGDLSSPQTVAHIHGPALPGTTGPTIFNLPLGSVDTVFSLTPTHAQHLRNGFLYFNVHTQDFPDGEIRGQILANPLDVPDFFVLQQYRDFLHREPDFAGLNYWTGQITACGLDVACIARRRTEVSAAFFLSQEFADTGFLVYRLYRAGLNRRPNYLEFMRERGRIMAGPDLMAEQNLFVSQFVTRPAFNAVNLPTQTPEQYVGGLFANAGIATTAAIRQTLIDGLVNGTESRASVLRQVVEIMVFRNAERNPAFVQQEYFGYLRRDSDPAGFDFWLDVLNNSGGNFRSMVCAFISSAEYQQRFSPVATRNDTGCNGL